MAAEDIEVSTDATSEETISTDSGGRQTQARPDLRVPFTIAFLAFIFIAPRFIDGSAFVVVLVGFFVVRWLYGRWKNSEPEI